MKVARLPDGHMWRRVADSAWKDPLDPSYAQRFGGRWNPPRSFPALYLNEDVATARSQIHRLLEGTPIEPEDLDPPWVLVSATLPGGQQVADARNREGLEAAGLPVTYPSDETGNLVPHEPCQAIGARAKKEGLRGVWARSAATGTDEGGELAWFPARTSSRARRSQPPIPFHDWFWEESAPV